MEQVKLERLLMEEVSGVDDPANQLPGWMVAKAAAAETTEKAGTPGTMAKIKGILLGAPQQEGLDMDRAELDAILDEREDSLVAKVAEAVAVSKSAPAEGEGATETPAATVEAETAPETSVVAITADDVQKAVDEAVEKMREDTTAIFEALIGRFENIETHLGVAARKSLDGQEADAGGEPVTKSTPDLADAIGSALARPTRV